MKRWLIIGLLACSSSSIQAQEAAPPEADGVLSIDAPAQAEPGTMVRCKLKGYKSEAGSTIIWDVLNGSKILDSKQLQEQGPLLLLTGLKSAEPYRIRAFVIVGGVTKSASASVIIGDPLPDPPKPDPVDPKPDDPPKPVDPSPAKVMVLFLVEERDAETTSKIGINGVPMRAWLDAHCKLGSDSRPEYRVWDDDYSDEQILGSHGQKWLDAYKLAKADRVKVGKGDNAPWVLISNGTDGESLEAPMDTAATFKLLQKWGGN